MKKIKYLFVLSTSLILVFGNVSNIYAEYQYLAVEKVQETVEPRGEVLEMRHAIINGKPYHRRWSITSNSWYDPAWIPD